MYVDRDKALALAIAPMEVEVERGRLRFFAEATGMTDPVYFDLQAALAAGHPDLPVPPTFLGNALELELPNPLGWLLDLGVDTSSTTHGEQSFHYHRMAYAGDRLVLRRSIADVYLKKGGALEFVVKKTDVMRGDELVAEVLCAIGVFHRDAGR